MQYGSGMYLMETANRGDTLLMLALNQKLQN